MGVMQNLTFILQMRKLRIRYIANATELGQELMTLDSEFVLFSTALIVPLTSFRLRNVIDNKVNDKILIIKSMSTDLDGFTLTV